MEDHNHNQGHMEDEEEEAFVVDEAGQLRDGQILAEYDGAEGSIDVACVLRTTFVLDVGEVANSSLQHFYK